MLKQHTQNLYRLWYALDAGIAALLFLWFVEQPVMQRLDFPIGLHPAWMLAIAAAVGLGSASLMAYFRLYGEQRRWGLGERTTRLLAAQGLFGLILSTLAFTFDAPVDRIFPVVFAGSLFAVQCASRIVVFGALSIARRALAQLGMGVLLGMPIAAYLLSQLETTDLRILVAFVADTGVLVLIGLLACVVPTLRALRIMPTEALRS